MLLRDKYIMCDDNNYKSLSESHSHVQNNYSFCNSRKINICIANDCSIYYH